MKNKKLTQLFKKESSNNIVNEQAPDRMNAPKESFDLDDEIPF